MNKTEDIVLFAINTGELYRRHLYLARTDGKPLDWRVHVQVKVMPLYRRMDAPGERTTLTPSELADVANALRDYYAEHLKEC